MNIKTIINEPERGCGFRKPGGLYLVSDPAEFFTCPEFPFPLEICPCCGAGIKPARGFTWINGKIIAQNLIPTFSCSFCAWGNSCLFMYSPEKVGLIWVGEQFYSTPGDFIQEANGKGISRRVSTIPNDFKLGETVVWLAHRKAIHKLCENCSGSGVGVSGETILCNTCNGNQFVNSPGVFSIFKPQRIEYILTGKEPKEELERMEKRGITLVKLVRE